MNKQIFFGQYKRIASYFEGTELASSGLPQGQELEILETRARQGAAGSVHHALHQSGRRQSGERARQSARGNAAAAARPATRCATRSMVNAKTGEPLTRRDSGQTGSRRSSASSCSTSRRSNVSASTSTCERVDDVAIRKSAAQLGLRHHHRLMGRIAVARQRAARLLGLARRRPAGLAQLRRHQEPGGRRADRARDLRQEPRRTGRRHQGARPRAAVEPLRRAAMDLRQKPHGALGPFWPTGHAAEIWRGGVPDDLVVGRGKAAKAGTRQ